MSSQQINQQAFAAEIQQDIQNIRRSEQNHQTNLVTNEAKVITNTEQSIATEIPIVTERIVTTEYIPVTYEKIIQKIPVVVGQRVVTGAPISQEKYVQGINVEYVQGSQQARVDLTPQMTLQNTGVQSVISQPLNMAAEKISQQQFQNQQQLTTQQVTTQQMQAQQFVPVQEVITTERVVLEAQHVRPSEVFGGLNQQMMQGQHQGLTGQQFALQQGVINRDQFAQGGINHDRNIVRDAAQKERMFEQDLRQMEHNLARKVWESFNNVKI